MAHNTSRYTDKDGYGVYRGSTAEEGNGKLGAEQEAVLIISNVLQEFSEPNAG